MNLWYHHHYYYHYYDDDDYYEDDDPSDERRVERRDCRENNPREWASNAGEEQRIYFSRVHIQL